MESDKKFKLTRLKVYRIMFFIFFFILIFEIIILLLKRELFSPELFNLALLGMVISMNFVIQRREYERGLYYPIEKDYLIQLIYKILNDKKKLERELVWQIYEKVLIEKRHYLGAEKIRNLLWELEGKTLVEEDGYWRKK